MENSYNQIFANRTKKLTINCLSELPYSDKVSVIRKQIFRSASSTAANYRAMCRARSNKEKYAKLCIVVEEADKTLFWLEIINELKMINQEEIKLFLMESAEIVKVTSAYKKKLGDNNQS